MGHARGTADAAAARSLRTTGEEQPFRESGYESFGPASAGSCFEDGAWSLNLLAASRSTQAESHGALARASATHADALST
ncbi:unnamed protein product [Lampetra planeri]